MLNKRNIVLGEQGSLHNVLQRKIAHPDGFDSPGNWNSMNLWEVNHGKQ